MSPSTTNPLIDAIRARLEQKRAALKNSDAAVNTLTDLIVAAANGEAQAENGSHLSMTEAVRGADALRQIYTLLTEDVDKLELRIRKELRLLALQAQEQRRASPLAPEHPR